MHVNRLIFQSAPIDHFDKIFSWEARWDNKDNSPFIAGDIFKPLDANDAGKPILLSGCYLEINKKYPLSLDQYAKALKVDKSLVEKALADDDRFIESRYKNINIRATIDNGYVISMVMSYDPQKS